MLNPIPKPPPRLPANRAGQRKRLESSGEPAWPADIAKAIWHRDHGHCQHPWCTRPLAEGTAAHHIVFQSQGGQDDADNGVLLCPQHHTLGNDSPHLSRAVRQWWVYCRRNGLLGEANRDKRDLIWRGREIDHA